MTYQLWSHAHLYDSDATGAAQKSELYPASLKGASHLLQKVGRKSSELLNRHGAASPSQTPLTPVDGRHSTSESDHLAPAGSIHGGSNESAPELQVTDEQGVAHDVDEKKGEGENKEEKPQISVWSAVILLVVVTVLVAVTAEFLVGSIEGLVDNSPLSEEWVRCNHCSKIARDVLIAAYRLG